MIPRACVRAQSARCSRAATIGPRGFSCSSVWRGLVRSPLWDGIPAPDREGFFGAAAAELPVGRVGETADPARAFTHLMTSDYTTGQTLVVDGGATVGAR
ncbi:SDR family oxidoreductase [Nocardia tengchongensis]|uniref:SDR family oxidoreductase n=1 Tax=Nocardia tengchongensis TaxID=2055889 RepID=UPI00369859A9